VAEGITPDLIAEDHCLDTEDLLSLG